MEASKGNDKKCNDKSKRLFPVINIQKISKDISDKVCLTCMFWTGYRKKENNAVISLSKENQGVCLWHKNTTTKACFHCNYWIGKYK